MDRLYRSDRKLPFTLQYQGPSWWSEITARYVDFRRLEGVQPDTVRVYLWALNPLGEHLEQLGVPAREALEGDHLMSWNRTLLDNLMESSRAVAVSTVRAFIRWGVEEELFSARLLRSLPAVRTHRGEANPISRHDMERLTGYFSESARTLIDLRTRALFWRLYQTGARIGEALRLNRADFLIGRRDARVRQKGGSHTRIDWGVAAEVAMAEYVAARLTVMRRCL